MTAIIRTNQSLPRLTPHVDVLERESEFVVRLDLPGAQPDDVEITIERDTLTIQASLGMTTPEGLTLDHAEFGAASYARQMRIADDIDRDAIQANWHNGVLELVLPRSESARPRKIEIRRAP
ncbi:MAG: Hsp20/alpha crystallin family protein [Planctomycetota bacterium]